MLDKVAHFNTYKFFLCLITVGHIMINLIFMFIYMLARIIDKSVSVNCNHHIRCDDIPVSDEEYIKDNCNSCYLNNHGLCSNYNAKHKTQHSTCSLLKRIHYKYPYIFFINIVGFIIEFILCVGWVSNDLILQGKIWLTANYSTAIVMLFISGFILVAVLVGHRSKQ